MFSKGSFWKRPSFRLIKKDLSELELSLGDFVQDRMEANERTKKRLKSLETTEDHVLEIIQPKSFPGKLNESLYQRLNDELAKTKEFEPLNLYVFAPADRKQRFRYIHGLCVTVCVQMYRLPKRNLAFIWKVPASDPNLLSETLRTIENIKQNIPTLHTGVMRQKIMKIFQHKRKIERSDLAILYNLLADNESIDEDDAIDRFEMKINAGVTAEEIFDEEEANTSKTKFDKFFDAAQALLDEQSGAIPDERRHGTTCNRSPLFVSLRDFHAKTVVKMNEMYPGENNVPSHEWFRLQLTPRNTYANTAKAYKCRINMKWRLQQRILRKSHPDHYYGSIVFRYFKEFATS